MRVALIFAGNIHSQGGKFNHVLERARRLTKNKDITCDVYIIRKKFVFFYSLFKKDKSKKEKQTIIDGVVLNNIWIKLTLWNYIQVHRLRIKDLICKRQLLKKAHLFKDYDLISTNDLLSSTIALKTKYKYNIPTIITWHGSDINVYPYRSKPTYHTIKELLKTSNKNIFVSKTLMNNSDKIIKTSNKTYLYAGIAEYFKEKNVEEKQVLKKKYQIHTKYTLGFVGNLKPIKNIKSLPLIFKRIIKEIPDVSFLIAGDGPLLNWLKEEVKNQKIKNIQFLGRMAPHNIPEIMNIIDVLVLPSENEGMPLVAVEAQKCGAHVVGSDVGGIHEAIGEKNCIPLDNNFIDNFANRIIQIIQNDERLNFNSNKFDWNQSILKEKAIYKEIIHSSKN